MEIFMPRIKDAELQYGMLNTLNTYEWMLLHIFSLKIHTWVVSRVLLSGTLWNGVLKWKVFCWVQWNDHVFVMKWKKLLLFISSPYKMLIVLAQSFVFAREEADFYCYYFTRIVNLTDLWIKIGFHGLATHAHARTRTGFCRLTLCKMLIFCTFNIRIKSALGKRGHLV